MVEDTKMAEEQTELGSFDEMGEFVEPKAEKTEEKPAEASQAENGEGDETPAEGEKTEKSPDGGDTKKVDFDGLTEAEKDQLIAELTKDGMPYHKNPAFQRIIKQRDGYKQRVENAIKRYAAKDPQGALEMLQDEGFAVDEAKAMLRDMGVNPEAVQKQDTQKLGNEENFEDDLAFLRIIQKQGYDVNSLTPEQRQFWQFTYKFMKSAVDEPQSVKMKALEERLNKFEQAEAQKLEAETRAKFTQSINDLKKDVKEEYGIEWNEENDRLMSEYLDSHPKFRGGVDELFILSHRDKLVEMGKIAANKETAELNEEKRLMNSEKPGSTGKETLPPGVGPGKSVSGTMRYLRSKYGA